MKIKKGSEAWHMMHDLIKENIKKRLEEYYEFDRFIADYDFIQISKNSFHLNVISSLTVD